MKLTKDQIEQLKKMISSKGYPYIDVQYEILDHVACKIEELMAHDPKLSLEAAFTKVHASFGIFGFSSLEESYEKTIQQKATKFTLEALVTIWTSWRIILPFGLTALFLGLAFFNQLFFGDSYIGSYLFAIGIFLILLHLITGRSWRSLKTYHQYAAARQSSPFAVLLYIGLYVAYTLLWHSSEIQWWNIASMSKEQWICIGIIFITFSLLLSVRKSIDHSIERTHKLQRLYETV
ncbi:hypothetical protein [Mongoliitalea lutea]|uniref:Uncharacterized protein n=1 Tax=Mongoliitalea lutea TaxID=849756 RepID=A0A8J3G4Y3_9BACT|nr:hypothetical protein [Mongoliitalea lutea]GHB34502.1 hypothetical protein GCM10008106_14880 [Mongoliitalea lutea]